MRIFGDPKRTQRYLQERRAVGRMERAAFNGEPLRRPDPGTLLRTLHVTDHITGNSYELQIRQGARKNGIEVYRAGRRVKCGGSFDGLFRMLRRNWSLRWLTA